MSAIPDAPIEDVERIDYDAYLAQACGPREVTPAGEARLSRAPYLQKTTASSSALVWVSLGDDAAQVVLTTPDGQPVATVPGVPDTSARHEQGKQFVAAIEGLRSDSVYCYRVQDQQGTAWVDGGFATAPATGIDTTVQFSVLGDLGKRSSDQYAVLDQLESVPSDFVLLAGDIAYDEGRRSEIEQNVFGVYGELMAWIPFFPASGNHEYSTEQAAPFREAFALFENGGPEGRERWYSFDWGPVHVAVLDTEVDLEPQRAWLETDLAAAAPPFTIVLLHRPPYSSGTHGSELSVRDAFAPVFERHGVELVLAGHDHDYERTHSIGGVTYVVTGGGGRGTREVGESEFTAYSARVAHFVHVTVEGDALRLVAIDATGEPFDAAEIAVR